LTIDRSRSDPSPVDCLGEVRWRLASRQTILLSAVAALALGAGRAAILAGVVWKGLVAVGISLAAGATAALFLARVAPPTERITYLAVALLPVAVAAAICLQRTRKESSIE
jgi:hypothetical protein